MKKIVLFIGSLLLTGSLVTSCLKDVDNSASINYVGIVDSIKYTEPTDTAWDMNIKEALQKMEVLYVQFQKDATVSSNYQYAIYTCDTMAMNDLNNRLKKVTLADIKKNIFNMHADSIVKLGYPMSDSIPLKPFALHSYLWSYYYSSKIYTTVNNIK